MKKLNMENAKAFLSKLKLGIKNHSPELLISLGVVGVVTSAVLACVATTKVKNILEESKQEIEDIHAKADTNENSTDAEVEHDTKKALTSVYLRTVVKFVKLYGLSVVLGGLSLASIITSNNILRKRNVALAAAYAAIDKGFKNYRANVVERFGEEVDKELRYGVKTQKVTEKKIDENGKEVKTKKDVKVSKLGVDGYSDYARYFDNTCKEWSPDHEYNMMLLRAKEQYANDLLKARGYLFLNEVYDELGIERSKAGQVVGWVYNKDNDIGDNYVAFGTYETNRTVDDNTVEPTIILDFNVDGYIMDRANLSL